MQGFPPTRPLRPSHSQNGCRFEERCEEGGFQAGGTVDHNSKLECSLELQFTRPESARAARKRKEKEMVVSLLMFINYRNSRFY